MNVTQKENRERLWHCQFRHLNAQNTQKLVKKELVNNLDYNTTRKVGVCEVCIGGKQCNDSFKPSETVTTMLLDLVHWTYVGKWVKNP